MNTTEILEGVIERILSDDDLPGMLAFTLLDIPDIPSTHWSLMNRFIRTINDTADARGFKQWLQVGRHVKKGAKAFHILGPRMFKDKEKDVMVLAGFVSIPVFRYEDTEGEELSYRKNFDDVYSLVKQYPLMDVADNLNLEIKIDFSNRGEAGSYNSSTKVIRLCDKSEETFFHELAHAIDDVLGNKAPPGDPMNEVVAELSSACMATMYSSKVNLNFTRKYLKDWSSGSIGSFVAQSLGRVNAILEYIKANTHSNALLEVS